MRIGRRDVRLTNLEKLYFPECGLTKGDLVSYYVDVADCVLHHGRRCTCRVSRRMRHASAARVADKRDAAVRGAGADAGDLPFGLDCSRRGLPAEVGLHLPIRAEAGVQLPRVVYRTSTGPPAWTTATIFPSGWSATAEVPPRAVSTFPPLPKLPSSFPLAV